MTHTDAFLPPHGGDRDSLLAFSGRSDEELLDFSVNVRPSGPPEFLRLAMLRALDAAGSYPSPDSAALRALYAEKLHLSPDSIVFGNGTSELFHALAHVLKESGAPCAVIPEPAFGDYEKACSLAGLPAIRPASLYCAPVKEGGLADWQLPLEDLLSAPKNAAVFLTNPGNPAGTFYPKKKLCSLFLKRPDITWIVDEAFLPYAGPVDALSVLSELAKSSGQADAAYASLNWVVVRSLTKFHALAGIRTGFLAGSLKLTQKIQAHLPTWNVNCLAHACMKALIEQKEAAAKDARLTRQKNRENRRHLVQKLAPLNLTVCRSLANFLLLRLDVPNKDLARQMLCQDGIAVRDCATYPGLNDGRWYRVSVRDKEDTDRLAAALAKHVGFRQKAQGAACSFCQTGKKKKTPALMLQGTSSGVGKSVLAAAFCRILHQDGYDAAPFKAQNMSLNSGVTMDGLEMGRAQILQAQAAGILPDVRMNPLLLKPLTDKGSQVILMGRPHSTMQARSFLHAREQLREPILQAYESLASEHEVMVLEGAGANCEVNLKESDLVNMSMAKAADARVLLAGDIDRGGVYGAFLGSWLTCTKEEHRLLAGFLVNRFRGDASLLAPAHDYILQATGRPVLGVIPYLKDLDLPEEDSVGLARSLFKPASLPDPLDVAMIVLGKTSNYTDMGPLGAEPDVTLRPVRSAAEWGNPDLVILPGSRSVAEDKLKLDASGLTGCLLSHVQKGGWLAGICGGMQLMGEKLLDPLHLESDKDSIDGLNLLPLATVLERGKCLTRLQQVATPFGVTTSGYEIHHGQTQITQKNAALRLFSCAEADGRFLGCMVNHLVGTYLHGLFDNDLFRRTFLDYVRSSLGKKPQGAVLARWNPDAALDRLADAVRESCDIKAIYRSLGI